MPCVVRDIVVTKKGSQMKTLQMMLVAITIAAVADNVSIAQTEYFFGDVDTIEVTEAQNDQLTAIERQRDDELDPLRKNLSNLSRQLRTTNYKFRQLWFDYEQKLEGLLTGAQLKSLNEQRSTKTKNRAKGNAKFLTQYAKFIEAVSAVDKVTVFEGLPFVAKDELAQLKQDNETIEIDGWAFYAASLNANRSIKEKLCSTFVDYREYMRHSTSFGNSTNRGAKGCGGFHPDFCVRWYENDQVFYVQVCLGCAELAFITPSGKVMFDFDERAWQSFAHVAIATFRHQVDPIKSLNYSRQR